MELTKLKLQYNAMLKRYNDALEYFEHATPENIDKYYLDFVELCSEIDKVGKEIEEIIGRKLRREEILEGFEQ